MEQKRHQGTSQHMPVPAGKASRGWGETLLSTAWLEGRRQCHLLEAERFRLELRKKKSLCNSFQKLQCQKTSFWFHMAQQLS